MLVTVEFPCDLVVADYGEVQKWDLEPWFERSPLAMYWVKVPIDVETWRERKRQVVIAENMKAVLTDVIGLLQDCRRFGWEIRANHIRALRSIAACEKEVPWMHPELCLQVDRSTLEAHSVPKQVATLLEFLLHPHPQFLPIHAGDACQLILGSEGHSFFILHATKRALDGASTCVVVGGPTPSESLARRATMFWANYSCLDSAKWKINIHICLTR